MNTIPLIFNQRQINRTVLGGTQAPPEVLIPVSVVLLNRNGSQYRNGNLESLLKCGFQSVISIEKDQGSYNIEDFAQRFPSVRFIVPLEKVTPGDMINIGVSESDEENVLVIWDDFRITANMLTPTLARRLVDLDRCLVTPRLVSSTQFGLPVQFIPFVKKGRFQVISSSTVTDGIPTLYPFDYAGLYNKRRFIQLGGYDYTITSPYWQVLDFGTRAWLWGEQITVSTAFQIAYETEPQPEDQTPDMSQLRFYLKNLVPVHKLDHGVIQNSAFFSFLMRSSCGLFEAGRQFADARSWTEKNKYRFRRDAVDLIEHWGTVQK